MQKKDGRPSGTGPRKLVLMASTVLGVYVCFKLVYPFLPALTWALALAVVTHRLHDRLAHRIRHPNFAAGFAVIIVAVLIVGPGILVGQSLITETTRGVNALRKQVQSEQWRATIEQYPHFARALNRVQPHVDIRNIAERAANMLAAWLSALVGGSLWIIAQLLIMLLTLFYLLRDREAILDAIKSFIPLSESDTDTLFSRIGNAIYATIYGVFAVALVQGTLGGLMFWLLGLPGPLLWGMIMTLLSLIPVLGTPVIWVPAAIFLALTGSWIRAVILTAWGVIVIGIIDNLLYPVLVGDKVRMHTLLVFFSVVGGLVLFGSSGLILGPVAVVVTNVLLEIWQRPASGQS